MSEHYLRTDYKNEGWSETEVARLRAEEKTYPDNLVFAKTTRPHSSDEAPTWEERDVHPTLNNFESGPSRAPVLILSTGASPARTSAWPAQGPVLGESALDSGLSSDGSCPNCGRDGSWSRMSQGSSVPMNAETSQRLLKGLQASGTAWPGANSTLNFCSFRSDAGESFSLPRPTLAMVLEPSVPRKYFLSAKAAAGILRRAAKRGKALPPALEAALRQVASTSPDEAAKTT